MTGRVTNQAAIWDGTFNNDVDNSLGYIYKGTFNGNNTVETAIGGTIDVTGILGGTAYFSSPVTVENDGTIASGNYLGEVTNAGTIEGGTFNNYITNNGLISGGTFNGDTIYYVSNLNGGTIDGGLFDVVVGNYQDGSISDGVFNYAVSNGDQGGVVGGLISGGTFNGEVSNYWDIYEGTFNGTVTNHALITGGTFAETGSVTNYSEIADFYGTPTFNGVVTNEAGAYIRAGTFNGAVTSRSRIEGGTFNGAVDNQYVISGGIFNGNGIDNPLSAGAGDYFYVGDGYELGGTSYFDAPVHIASGEWGGGGGLVSGGHYLQYVLNEGRITSGTFDEIVGNSGVISGGTFTDYVLTLNGSITGGDFSAATLMNATMTNYDGFLHICNYDDNWNHDWAGADRYFENYGTILGGNYLNTLINDGTIVGGTFQGNVSSSGGGIIAWSEDVPLVFNGIVFDIHLTIASGAGAFDANTVFLGDDGVFSGGVTNQDMITGGTFTGSITNSGDITGGTYTLSGNFTQTAGSFVQTGDFSAANFTQTGGTFTDADPLGHAFSIAGSFSVPYAEAGTFNRYTGAGTPSDPYMIRDLYDLQAMKNHLTSHFKMTASLDAVSVADWNSGAGFDPIGDATHAFTGVLSGFGKVVSNLAMDRTDQDYVGLFGHIGIGGVVSELALEKVSAYGRHYVGGLAGLNQGTLSNVYTTGSFTVSGVNFIGGLVGGNTGSIANAYSSARVLASGASVGGLAGSNTGAIHNTYAMGHVTGGSSTGGLVGSGSGTVTNSFWNEKMTGQTTSAGGTAGKVIRVTEEVDENGYAVLNPDDVADPNADMMNSETYAGWDFGSTWVMDEGGSFPHFQYRYPEGVRGVWGIAYNLDSGSVPVADVNIGLYVNPDSVNEDGTFKNMDLGTQRDLTKSAADGMYYFVMGTNDVQYYDAVIGKIENNPLTGNTRMPAEERSIIGLDIWGNLERGIGHAYKEPLVRIPTLDPEVEKAQEEVNRSLQNIMSNSGQLASLEGVWGRAADVQIQDETFSVPGTEWLDRQDLAMDQPGHASISFYENLAPGQEPMPLYTVTPVEAGSSFGEPGNMRSVMLDVAAQGFSPPNEGRVEEPSDGKFALSEAGREKLGGGTGPVEKSIAEENEAMASGAASASEAAASEASEQAFGEAASGSDEASLTGEGETAEGEVTTDEASLEKDSQMTESAASGKEGEGKAVGGMRPDFFNADEAKKLLTDVRVIEGAVYVLDSTNEMALLDRGESLRVSYKKQQGGEPRAEGTAPKQSPQLNAPSLILHSPFAVRSEAKSAATVAKAEPLAAAKGAVSSMGGSPLNGPEGDASSIVEKGSSIDPVGKDDERATSMKEDASAAAVELPKKATKDVKEVPPAMIAQKASPEARTLPLAPKEVVAVGAPVTGFVKAGTHYGILKDPGKNVFVKCGGGEWQAAKDGMVILPGDEIRTASNGSVEVLLDGNKVGRVEIKEGSLFRINKAETDALTGDKTTLLDLAIGKVLVQAEKLQGRSRFEVKTPTALTGVRGTVFIVEVKGKA